MKAERSEIFKALSVETRIQILELLKSNEKLGVKELSSLLGLTPAAISQHLKAMKHVGIVKSKKAGCCNPYSVNKEVLEEHRHVMNNLYSCRCTENMTCSSEETLSFLEEYKAILEEKLRIVEEKIAILKAE